jgi:hypothetical protein
MAATGLTSQKNDERESQIRVSRPIKEEGAHQSAKHMYLIFIPAVTWTNDWIMVE